MENLKLGQIIFVTTTLLLDGEIFKLHKTKLEDAITDRFGTHIRMANDNNWGACPTRSRDQVVTNRQELDALLDKSEGYKHHKQGNIDNPKKNVYKASFSVSRQEVTIQRFQFNQNITSLKEGSYSEYICKGSLGTTTLKVYNEELPSNFFYTMEEAVKEVGEIVNDLLN